MCGSPVSAPPLRVQAALRYSRAGLGGAAGWRRGCARAARVLHPGGCPVRSERRLGVKFSEFLSLKNSLPFKASLEHGQNQRVRSYFSRISNSALQHYLMGDFLVGHRGTDAGSWWTLKQLGLITKLATFPNFPLKSYLNRGSFSGVNLLTHHCGQGCLI